MRCVNFIARGVLVLSLVLALGAPATYARPRTEEPPSRNPIVKLIQKLVLKVCGDGIIIPWP